MKTHRITKITSKFNRAAFLAVVSLGAFAFVAQTILPAQAASITNSYSPTSKSLANGENVAMTITTNAGSNHVLTDQLRVTYDAAKLKFVSISYAGSPLDQSAPEEGAGSGYYQIARYTLGTKPTGNFTLATVTFQALASSGTAAVGYTAGSSSIYIQEDGGTVNALTGVTGASYTLTAPADTTKPSVGITAPTNNSTISGSSVSLSANASDNVGVTKVEFYLDTTLKATDTTSPYSTTVDSKSVSDGSHTMTAKAFDSAGNNNISAIAVTVKNNTTTTTTPPKTTTPTTTTTTTTTPKTTTPTNTTTTTNTTSTPATTSNGVQVAEESPYTIETLPDTGTTKSKKVSTPVIAGASVAVLVLVGAVALFVMRMIQARKQAAIFSDHSVNIPNGATLYNPTAHPTSPVNVPGSEITPNNSSSDTYPRQ